MKVLQLSTYPIAKPLHGGQIRVSEISNHFTANGCEVLSLSICEPTHAQYNYKNDFIMNMANVPTPYDLPFCTDFLTSKMVTTHKAAYQFLLKHIRRFMPDIILCEQFWLYSFVESLFENKILNRDNVYLVYSSHNIESQTKKDILNRHDLYGEKVDLLVNEIAMLEINLAKNADHVICVTQKDADYFNAYSRKKVMVCPNGVANRTVDLIEKERIQNAMTHRPYLFFCGSAYPPNAQGFWDMFGPSMTQFPPECMIVVAGGVGHNLWNYAPPETQKYIYVNQSIIRCIGPVQTSTLAALIDCAKGIILPITCGGGSNLKTAEAIASLKPVIATTTATRGFDFTNQLSNFHITDDPCTFSQTACHMLLDKIKTTYISKDEIKIRKQVYWGNTLAPLDLLLCDARQKLNLP